MVNLGIMLEGQEDLTWEKWHDFADRTEGLGFESLWRSDHLHPLVLGPDKEVLEAWISFATLAARTERIRFGAMVTPMTFRHPSVLAKMAASIDVLSKGRLEMGLGAGWCVPEHTAFGIPFYDWKTRYGMLEEGLEIIKAMWTEDNVTFKGQHYTLEGATSYPKPYQSPHPPFVIGGNGEKRTLPITAKYAQEWNGISLTVEGFVAKRALLHRLCREINRNPDEISISLTGTAIIGRDDQDYARRLARVANILGPEKGVADATPDELMDKGWIVGTPDRVVERILAYSEAGASRVIFQLYDYEDTELLDVIAEKVLPRVS